MFWRKCLKIGGDAAQQRTASALELPESRRFLSATAYSGTVSGGKLVVGIFVPGNDPAHADLRRLSA